MTEKRREGRREGKGRVREEEGKRETERELERSISILIKAFYFGVPYSGISPTLTNISLFLRPGFQAFSGYQWANILAINYPLL